LPNAIVSFCSNRTSHSCSHHPLQILEIGKGGATVYVDSDKTEKGRWRSDGIWKTSVLELVEFEM
jgi:hypothetical protein